MLNREAIDQLKELGDDPAFCEMLVRDYLKQANTLISEMDAAPDNSYLQKRAHSLKGSSLTIGLDDVSRICDKLNLLAKDNDPNHEIKSTLVSLKHAQYAGAHALVYCLCPLSPPENDDNIPLDDMSVLADKGILNEEIFGQLLELDTYDDSGSSFCSDLALEYISQAGDTIKTIHDTLTSSSSIQQKLDIVYQKGHFLKGSSSAIGLCGVSSLCEQVQNLGKCKDVDGNVVFTAQEALNMLISCLPNLKYHLYQGSQALITLCKIQSPTISSSLDQFNLPSKDLLDLCSEHRIKEPPNCSNVNNTNNNTLHSTSSANTSSPMFNSSGSLPTSPPSDSSPDKDKKNPPLHQPPKSSLHHPTAV